MPSICISMPPYASACHHMHQHAIHMHQHATMCISMPSICISMPPYASACHPYASACHPYMCISMPSMRTHTMQTPSAVPVHDVIKKLQSAMLHTYDLRPWTHRVTTLPLIAQAVDS
eukprot:1160018-Pelagomonas_calceolata.AAC.13